MILKTKLICLINLKYYPFVSVLILYFGLTSLVLAQKEDKSKYPDIVVEAYYSGYFDVFEQLYGGQGLNFPIRMNPDKILGENKEKWFVSLPKDSYIILEYTDNEIIDAPNQPDIIVVEHGCCDEWAEIYVSNDGKEFTFLGVVNDCGQDKLDLADIGYDKPVRFVKVVGLDVKCASPGFDLVSAHALPGANKRLYVGMDQVEEYFEEERTDEILILENVYFDIDEDQIQYSGTVDLNKVIKKLLEFPEIKIKVSGHTDNVATAAYNLNLSKRRAKAVKEYLIQNNIKENRIETEGFGLTRPLRTNETEEGRAQNRRVEIRRLN